MIVLDCSAAMPWCFEDEASPEGDALAERVAEEGALVPGLWFIEVANVLFQAEKRGRITLAKATKSLSLLEALPIQTEPQEVGHIWRETLPLARQTGLTVYDASYLDLARRHGLPLATRDADLAKAAQRLGIATLP
jgi:predicted nucleic acid-binding protein